MLQLRQKVPTGAPSTHGPNARSRRQFLLVCLRSIDLVGRPAPEDRVGSIGIIVADPTFDPGSCLAAALKGIEEDAFVFQRSPQPFNEGFQAAIWVGGFVFGSQFGHGLMTLDRL